MNKMQYNDDKSIATKLFQQKDRLYAKALRFWYASLYINFGTFFVILISLFIKNEILIWAFGFIQLISPLLLISCRIVFESKFRKADQCNRLLHYSDSLGIPIPPDLAACLLGEHLSTTPHLSYATPYYVAHEQSGPARLISNTRESSFFTFNLARHTKSYCLVAAIAMTLIATALLYSITTTHANSAADFNYVTNYAKIISVIISFFFTGDIFVLYVKLSQMSTEAELAYHVFDRILNQREINIETAMIAVEEYHISIIQGVPIPVFIYLRYRDSLNFAYQNAHEIAKKKSSE